MTRGIIVVIFVMVSAIVIAHLAGESGSVLCSIFSIFLSFVALVFVFAMALSLQICADCNKLSIDDYCSKCGVETSCYSCYIWEGENA